MREKKRVSETWSPQARWNSLVVLTCLLYMAYISLQQCYLRFGLSDWLTTEGVMLESRVHYGGRYGDTPIVRYHFEVEGTHYEGDRLSVGGVASWGGREGIEARLSKMPVGKHVVVYYDPDDPSYSALTQEGSFNVSFFSFMLFGFASALLIYYRFFKYV